MQGSVVCLIFSWVHNLVLQDLCSSQFICDSNNSRVQYGYKYPQDINIMPALSPSMKQRIIQKMYGQNVLLLAYVLSLISVAMLFSMH